MAVHMAELSLEILGSSCVQDPSARDLLFFLFFLWLCVELVISTHLDLEDELCISYFLMIFGGMSRYFKAFKHF